MGYGRSYDIGVFGSIFGHAVTQNLPVLAVQNLNPNSQTDDVFNLSKGPTAPVFPSVPSNGLLPLPDGIFARSRPNRMRLARLDAYNLRYNISSPIVCRLSWPSWEITVTGSTQTTRM